MAAFSIFLWVCWVGCCQGARVAKMWANTTSLTVSWKSPGAFCLCFATAERFQRGLGFFDCIPYRRESRCDLAPRFANCTSVPAEQLRCETHDSSETSTMRDLRAGTTYAFCVIDVDPTSKTGYENHALCTRTWTLDTELHFRTRVYSHYMLGLEWTLGNETENLFNVRLCVSRDGCDFACKDNLVETHREKYVDWVDLSKEKARLQVRRTDGVLLLERSFSSRRGAPDRPCQVVASPMGPSTLRVSWLLEDKVDGFLVRHCCFFWCRSAVHLEPAMRYVFLGGLLPWTRCRVAVQAFRTVNNTQFAMSDPGHAEAATLGDPKQLLWSLVVVLPAAVVCITLVCKKRREQSEVWQVRCGRNTRGSADG